MKRIIIYFGSGRLGNQIPQYLALKKVDANAKIISYGMESLQEVVDDKLVSRIYFSFFIRIILKVIDKRALEKMFLSFPLFSKVIFQENSSNFTYQRIGFFSNITVVDSKGISFLHIMNSAKMENNFIYFKEDYTKTAQNLLKKLHCSKENLFFIHIRRGDYKFWPSKEYNALLPLAWYLNQIDYIRSKKNAAHFLIVTDDHAFVESHISEKPWITISKQNEFVDFFLMQECQGGGIMSASTFSYVAAWLTSMKQPNSKVIYIAPEYWVSFRRRTWLFSEKELIKTVLPSIQFMEVGDDHLDVSPRPTHIV